jgi:hypothetical protein
MKKFQRFQAGIIKKKTDQNFINQPLEYTHEPNSHNKYYVMGFLFFIEEVYLGFPLSRLFNNFNRSVTSY